MPSQQDEKSLELQFPMGGLERSIGYDKQPPGTTPVGENVRGFEPLTMRARGGSRHGLSRYVAARPNGAHVIQHMDIIVDPTTDALLDNFDDPNGVLDPTGLRRVRRGGSGRQPNRNKKKNIKFVQVAGNSQSQAGDDTTPLTVPFASNVTSGNMLFAVMALSYSNDDTLTIADSQGNLWTRAVTVTKTHPGNGKLEIWYAPTHTTGACTVHITPASDLPFPGALHTMGLEILEYSGVDTLFTLDGTKTNDTGASVDPAGSLTTGLIPVAEAKELILVAFLPTSDVTTDYTAGTGFTKRKTNAVNLILLAVEDQILAGSASGGGVTGTMTWNTDTSYAAVGASFKAASG